MKQALAFHCQQTHHGPAHSGPRLHGRVPIRVGSGPTPAHFLIGWGNMSSISMSDRCIRLLITRSNVPEAVCSGAGLGSVTLQPRSPASFCIWRFCPPPVAVERKTNTLLRQKKYARFKQLGVLLQSKRLFHKKCPLLQKKGLGWSTAQVSNFVGQHGTFWARSIYACG